MLASLLRSELEARIAPDLGALASLLAERRPAIREAFPDLARRRAFFRAVLAAPEMDGSGLDAAIAKAALPAGRVSFILEPPAEDLISVRAVRALARADVVVTGPDTALIDRHARRDAERRSPEEASPAWIAASARAGLNIAVLVGAVPVALARELGELAEVLAPAPPT